MIPFLLVFFTVYGGMNFYVFMKAKAVFSLGIKGSVPLAVFMVFMVLAPFIIRTAERVGFEQFARSMAYVGYAWLGLVFLFLASSFALELYSLSVRWSATLLRKDAALLLPSPVFSFFIPLALALAVSVYGYFEALHIKTERLTVSTAKLPEGVDKIRVVQISDVHLGLTVRKKRLEKILHIVRAEAPDILVSTGDLVDGQINGLTELVAPLREITPRYGKYAVTGNHEFYAGLGQALEFSREAGFEMLRGEGLTVAGLVNIAGVDYPSRWTTGEKENIPEEELLRSLPDGRFTMLLKHVPLVNRKSLGLFDLQLSGHTHKGQIFPFSLFTRLVYPRIAGLFSQKGSSSSLYVSRGSGTWGPPVRFLSPPEVTVIDIVSETR